MSFWKQLVGSLIKTTTYVQLVQLSTGKAIVYLMLLVLFMSLAAGIKLAVSWNGAVDMMDGEFEKKVPNFSFVNGELAVQAPMPLVLEKTKDFLLIVDTSGKMDASILKGAPKGIFIGKNVVFDKKNEFETSTFDMRGLQGVTFTRANVKTIIPWAKWLDVLFPVFFFIGGMISGLISAFLLGLVGWIISKIMSLRLGFANLYKISIYALSFPLIVDMVHGMGLRIPYFSWIFWVMAIAYMVAALLVLKQHQAQTPPEIIQ